MVLLVILFVLTAIIYASVGFGGGSTYTALLALSDTDYQLLPIISLICNLIVVTGGVWSFARAGKIPWVQAAPLCIISVPLAWIGGQLIVPETLFVAILAVSLSLTGIILFNNDKPNLKPHSAKRKKTSIHRVLPQLTRVSELIIGGTIGFLSGIVGIGGGIFLAPVLHFTRWGHAHQIAGVASLFIMVNSIAGLSGQLTKIDSGQFNALYSYLPLFVAVLIGGQIGSRISVFLLPPFWIKRITALLILLVSARLFARLFAIA